MKLRHVFYVKPPEEMITVASLPYTMFDSGQSIGQPPNVFLDIQVYDGEVTVLGWGCVLDGTTIQPVWVTEEIIEREKRIAARHKL
jgi:hypothetical protein